MGSGSRLERFLVLALIAPDLLAREAELLGDGALLDVLGAGLGDGAAEREALALGLSSGRHVGVSRRDNGRHRVWHLPSMARLLAMMPHGVVPRKL